MGDDRAVDPTAADDLRATPAGDECALDPTAADDLRAMPAGDECAVDPTAADDLRATPAGEQRAPDAGRAPSAWDGASIGGLGVAELLGGPRGVVESTIPGVVFAMAYSLNGQSLSGALWVALGTGALIMVVSLVQRRPLRQAVGGFVGVAVMAAVARWTGRAEDFYLPSVLKNAGQGLLFLISILVRWPLLGVVLGPVLGEGFAWRRDPRRLRAYAIASWFWVAMFGIRFAIQLPLYLAGAVTAIGLVNIPLGLPLFVLTCWLSYLVLRRAPMATPQPGADAAAPDDAGPDDEGGDESLSAGRSG